METKPLFKATGHFCVINLHYMRERLHGVKRTARRETHFLEGGLKFRGQYHRLGFCSTVCLVRDPVFYHSMLVNVSPKLYLLLLGNFLASYALVVQETNDKALVIVQPIMTDVFECPLDESCAFVVCKPSFQNIGLSRIYSTSSLLVLCLLLKRKIGTSPETGTRHCWLI
jgi:hypothetical protein